MFESVGIDFMLAPGLKEMPYLHSELNSWGNITNLLEYTNNVCQLAVPCIAIPTPIRHENGLPAGVLVWGKPGQDKELLKFALELEKAIKE
jgi:Asp-tRNA(Asn)/Glu-tRNA(Gln) amidotransferase A subunit family amidase